MELEYKAKIETIWKIYHKKYLISKFWFVSINVFSFSASALLIIINLFTLKYNTLTELGDIKSIFVALTIITGTGTFFISINTVFQFKEKKDKYNRQIQAISKLLEQDQKITNEDFFKLINELEIVLIE